MIKSDHEIALMQTAKNITLEVHKAAARIMREGITTTEVQAFITAAHRKLGSEGDPAFNGCCSARRRPIRTGCRIRRR